MDKLKIMFLQLSGREQRLVIISAIFVLVAIFYWGIWSPLNTSIERGQTTVKNQTELLAYVRLREKVHDDIVGLAMHFTFA